MSKGALPTASGVPSGWHVQPSPAQVKILAATRALIQRKGGADVTMAEIAKASGLSRQAIYLHFEDRGALIQALGRYADDRRGLDIEVEHVLENASGVEAMSRFVELLTRTNPGIWVLARAADAVRRTDPAVEDTWQERVRIRLKICVAIIERIRTEGMLREGMDVETAVDLLWTLTSLRMWEDLVEVRGWTPAKYSDYICNILATTLTRTLPGSGLGE